MQIHIPKLGIHGRLEPRNLDDDGLPDDLQLLKALQVWPFFFLGGGGGGAKIKLYKRTGKQKEMRGDSYGFYM